MSEPISTLNKAEVGTGHTIRIVDRGPIGQVTLRGDLSASKLKKAVKAGTGVDVPGALACAFSAEGGAVWMSPDELLLFTAYDEAEAMVSALDEALTGTHHLALNVSDARAVIALEGAGVAEVLAKGAPLDFSAFPVGHARRTHLANVAAGIWRRSETEWEVVCFRSFAKHLFDFLSVSAREGSEVGAF